MVRLRNVVVAALAAALMSAGSASAANPYPPPSSGSATVTPSKIRAGDCATFAGNGFAPGATVAIGDNGTPRGTATADGNGDFSKQLCYTVDAKRGKHTLTGTGTGSRGDTLTVSAVLIVEGVRQSPSGQTSGGVQGPTPNGIGDASGPGGGSNSGTRLITLVLGGLLLGLGGSLLLLLLAKRRRRDDEPDTPVESMLA